MEQFAAEGDFSFLVGGPAIHESVAEGAFEETYGRFGRAAAMITAILVSGLPPVTIDLVNHVLTVPGTIVVSALFRTFS